MKRLSNRDDVYGVTVATMDGRILSECDALKNWIPSLASLCSFARHIVRSNDSNDYIQALRLKTKTYEIIITTHNDQLLIVMQMSSSSGQNDSIVANKSMEEDWEEFLKRIQEQKLQKE